MAVTAKRLYKGTPGTAITTGYTVPASTSAIIKNITLTNKTAAEAVITITAAGIELAYQHKVAVGEIVILDLTTVLVAGETIMFTAGTANAINVFISGVEVTA